ncbi:1-acyl-sn-glycerol-3-phosphate acyltransferase alpha isoform X1 [Anabrus simplex]
MALADLDCCQCWVLAVLAVATLLVLLTRKDGKGAVNYHGRFALYIGSVSLTAIICLPLFLIRPCNVLNCYYVSKLLRHVSWLVGIKYELRGGEHLAEERGGVIVANHQSMLDILGMFNIWHVMHRCAAVARKEVFYVWPFGLAAWLGGVVFIDRVHPARANEQLADASKLMITNKVKLWLYPEGTRNKDITTMLPFKKGAFRVAVTCQVPIYPVVYSPYYMVNGKTKFFGKGKVIIKALPPIPTEGLTSADIDSLMERTRSVMLEAHSALYKEVMSSIPPDYPGR